jgi:hypothetical protein
VAVTGVVSNGIYKVGKLVKVNMVR